MAATLNYNYYRVPQQQAYVPSHLLSADRSNGVHLNTPNTVHTTNTAVNTANMNAHFDTQAYSHAHAHAPTPTPLQWNNLNNIHTQTQNNQHNTHTFNASGKRNRGTGGESMYPNAVSYTNTSVYADTHTHAQVPAWNTQSRTGDDSGLAKVIKRIRLSSPEQGSTEGLPFTSFGNTPTSAGTKLDNVVYGSQLYTGTHVQTHTPTLTHTRDIPGFGIGNGMGIKRGAADDTERSTYTPPYVALDPTSKRYSHSKVTPLDDRPVAESDTNDAVAMETTSNPEPRIPTNRPEDMQVVLYDNTQHTTHAEQHKTSFSSIPAHVLSNLSIHRPIPIPTDLNALVVYDESVAKGRACRIGETPSSKPLAQVEEIDEDVSEDDIMLM